MIPSGVVPPNPLELLSSIRFAEAMKWLEDSFDVVVIDSPPLQLVSDPLILSQFANSVIYVVKADSTPYQVALGGLARLREAKAHVWAWSSTRWTAKRLIATTATANTAPTAMARSTATAAGTHPSRRDRPSLPSACPGSMTVPKTLPTALQVRPPRGSLRHSSAVVTPHMHAGRYENRAQGIRQACRRFQAVLDQEGIALRIQAAAEVRLDHDVLTWVADGQVPFLGLARRVRHAAGTTP
jgi:hypothetical protein